jgi:hypothetical protein
MPSKQLPWKGQQPSKGIGDGVSGQQQMAHLWMQQPVEKLTIDHSPAANARAHREINQDIQPLAVTPAIFPQGGGIHIGIKPDGDGKCFSQGTHQIHLRPVGFGRL